MKLQVALKLSPRSIGGDGFRAWIDELYQKRVEGHARPEDVSFRHITEPISPDEVLRIVAELFDVEPESFKRRSHNSPLRAVAARMLIRYAGLRQRDVADLLNIGSGAAVCNQLKRLPLRISQDRHLGRLVKRVDERLAEARRAHHVEHG